MWYNTRVLQKYLVIAAMIYSLPNGIGQVTKIDNPAKKSKITLSSQLDRLYSRPAKDSMRSIIQPMIFDEKRLPIFCKMEHKIAKSSKINVMMRLGSLDYVNKLEGKD